MPSPQPSPRGRGGFRLALAARDLLDNLTKLSKAKFFA